MPMQRHSDQQVSPNSKIHNSLMRLNPPIISFVGAGSLMPMQRYLDQQVPLNSKIHNSLRHLNPPILENTDYLPIKPLSNALKTVPKLLNTGVLR